MDTCAATLTYQSNNRKKRVEVYKLVPCGEEQLIKVKVGVIRLFDKEKVFIPREGAKLTAENLLDIGEHVLQE